MAYDSEQGVSRPLIGGGRSLERSRGDNHVAQAWEHISSPAGRLQLLLSGVVGFASALLCSFGKTAQIRHFPPRPALEHVLFPPGPPNQMWPLTSCCAHFIAFFACTCDVMASNWIKICFNYGIHDEFRIVTAEWFAQLHCRGAESRLVFKGGKYSCCLQLSLL